MFREISQNSHETPWNLGLRLITKLTKTESLGRCFTMTFTKCFKVAMNKFLGTVKLSKLILIETPACTSLLVFSPYPIDF